MRSPVIKNVSSINLRTLHRGESRTLDEPVKFVCSMCGKRKYLGKTTDALVRIRYVFDGEECDAHICGACMDVLTDAARYGPRVVRELNRWKLRSRVTRASLVEDELICPSCWKKNATHVFIKYDDFLYPNSKHTTLRICAQCFVSYVVMLRETGELKRRFRRIQVEEYEAMVL